MLSTGRRPTAQEKVLAIHKIGVAQRQHIEQQRRMDEPTVLVGRAGVHVRCLRVLVHAKRLRWSGASEACRPLTVGDSAARLLRSFLGLMPPAGVKGTPRMAGCPLRSIPGSASCAASDRGRQLSKRQRAAQSSGPTVASRQGKPARQAGKASRQGKPARQAGKASRQRQSGGAYRERASKQAWRAALAGFGFGARQTRAPAAGWTQATRRRHAKHCGGWLATCT
jgi:hypothetical protein